MNADLPGLITFNISISCYSGNCKLIILNKTIVNEGLMWPDWIPVGQKELPRHKLLLLVFTSRHNIYT